MATSSPRPRPGARPGSAGARRRPGLSAAPSPGEPLHLVPASPDFARQFALIVGGVYLVVGLVGFIATGFSEGIVTHHGAKLLGLELNPFHNLVHIVIGAAFIGVSRVTDAAITQGVLIGGGVIYLAAALLGFLNKLPILAINGSLDADNFLHLFSGAAAVIVGVIAARQQAAAAPPGL